MRVRGVEPLDGEKMWRAMCRECRRCGSHPMAKYRVNIIDFDFWTHTHTNVTTPEIIYSQLICGGIHLFDSFPCQSSLGGGRTKLLGFGQRLLNDF
jgi:hypothetical protein